MSDHWYVGRHTPVGEHKSGPMSLAQLKQMAADGQLGATDLIYHQGMAGWTPVSRVPELAYAFRSSTIGTLGPATPYQGNPYHWPADNYRRPVKGIGNTTPIVFMVLLGLGVVGILWLTTIPVGQSTNVTFTRAGSVLAAMDTKPVVDGKKYTQDEFRQLVAIESKQTVRRRLGPPDEMQSQGNGVDNVWIYRHRTVDGVPAWVHFGKDGVVDAVSFFE